MSPTNPDIEKTDIIVFEADEESYEIRIWFADHIPEERREIIHDAIETALRKVVVRNDKKE